MNQEDKNLFYFFKVGIDNVIIILASAAFSSGSALPGIFRTRTALLPLVGLGVHQFRKLVLSLIHI